MPRATSFCPDGGGRAGWPTGGRERRHASGAGVEARQMWKGLTVINGRLLWGGPYITETDCCKQGTESYLIGVSGGEAIGRRDISVG